jgi:hypothetical protein
MSQPILRRQLGTECRVLDVSAGIVEYVASDETIDSYGEVIRAKGWKFDRFQKNAPFVDSHQYDKVDCLLGSVIDFKIDGSRLIETVQWAIDVPSNTRARIGWDMTRAGYLKAVSVGFIPIRVVSRWDQDKTGWQQQLSELGLHEEYGVRAVYVEHQQIELSAVIVPANPNALVNVGRAFKEGVIREADLEVLAQSLSVRPLKSDPDDIATSAIVLGQAEGARAQGRDQFLQRLRNVCGLKL